MSGCSASVTAIKASEDRRRVTDVCGFRGWNRIVCVWVERLEWWALIEVTMPPLAALDEDDASN